MSRRAALQAIAGTRLHLLNSSRGRPAPASRRGLHPTDVQLDIVLDDFLAGMLIALRDLASGDLVLAAQDFNGLTVSSEDLVPLSASLDPSGCGGECRQAYAFTFTHPDGPAVTIASGNRGSLSAGGRDYDILVVGAILNGCEEHSDMSEWIIGSVPSP